MSATTAVLLLAAAWAGSLAGLRLALAPVPAAVTAVAVLVTTAVVVVGRGHGPVWRMAILCAAVALVALAGAAVRTHFVHHGPLAELASHRPVAVHAGVVPVGDVRAPPDVRPWVLARLMAVQPAAGGLQASRERVLLRLPDGAVPAFGAGHRIAGLASVIDGPAAAWFASQGVAVAVDVHDLVEVAPAPGWQAATTWVRQRVSAAAHRHLPVDQASLLTGLVTGDLRWQPDDVGDDVLASGLSHLTAVSGSNVAVVVGGVLGLTLLLGSGRRGGWWACLAAVWWFVVLVRAEPSVVRAAVMATLVLAAMLLGRVRSTAGLLATTGLLVLLADPPLAARPGFALSMAATAGVLLLAPWLADRMEACGWLPRPSRLVLAATCGAQLAVTPLLIGLGGEVHAASVPANLIAVPAAAVASTVGGAMALLAMVWVEGAGMTAWLAQPALAVVLWSARTFAGDGGRQAGEALLALVAVVVVWRTWPALPPAARRVAPALGLAAAVGLVGLPGPTGGLPDTPVLVALDIGQGDALLLGDPAAGWVLIDGGPDPALLARALDDAGVSALAAVIASHPHADHTAGLAHPLTAMDVGALLVGPTGRWDAALLAAAGDGVTVVDVAAGDTWIHGRMRLTVLAPPATGLGEDPNDNSLVIRVDVAGGRSVLLTGDAEVLTQTLLADDPLIDVDVLKVPHHGGATNAPGFLAATTPQDAVISVGVGNGFGHPHPDVLADLAGVPLVRTDRDGTTTIPLAR